MSKEMIKEVEIDKKLLIAERKIVIRRVGEILKKLEGLKKFMERYD